MASNTETPPKVISDLTPNESSAESNGSPPTKKRKSVAEPVEIVIGYVEKTAQIIESFEVIKIKLTVVAHLTNAKNPILAFHIDVPKARKEHPDMEIASKRVQYDMIHLDAEYKRETQEKEKEYMKARLRKLMGVSIGATQKDARDDADGRPSKFTPPKITLGEEDTHDSEPEGDSSTRPDTSNPLRKPKGPQDWETINKTLDATINKAKFHYDSMSTELYNLLEPLGDFRNAHASEQDTIQKLQAQLDAAKDEKSMDRKQIKALTAQVQELQKVINELKDELLVANESEEVRELKGGNTNGEKQMGNIKHYYKRSLPRMLNTGSANGSSNSSLHQNLTAKNNNSPSGFESCTDQFLQEIATRADSFQAPAANMYRSASTSAVLQAPVANMHQLPTSASLLQPPFPFHATTPKNPFTAAVNDSTISLAAYAPFPANSANAGLYYSKSLLTVMHNGQCYNERTVLAPLLALGGISGEMSGTKQINGKTFKVYVERGSANEKGGKKVKLVESPTTYGPENFARGDGGENFVKYTYLEEVVNEAFSL